MVGIATYNQQYKCKSAKVTRAEVHINTTHVPVGGEALGQLKIGRCAVGHKICAQAYSVVVPAYTAASRHVRQVKHHHMLCHGVSVCINTSMVSVVSAIVSVIVRVSVVASVT